MKFQRISHPSDHPDCELRVVERKGKRKSAVCTFALMEERPDEPLNGLIRVRLSRVELGRLIERLSELKRDIDVLTQFMKDKRNKRKNKAVPLKVGEGA